MMRSQAIYGDPGVAFQRIAGRQGGAWAERTVRGAMPRRQPPPADRDARLRALADLRARGAVTDAEYTALRRRLGP